MMSLSHLEMEIFLVLQYRSFQDRMGFANLKWFPSLILTRVVRSTSMLELDWGGEII